MICTVTADGAAGGRLAVCQEDKKAARCLFHLRNTEVLHVTSNKTADFTSLWAFGGARHVWGLSEEIIREKKKLHWKHESLEGEEH